MGGNFCIIGTRDELALQAFEQCQVGRWA